jgi:hypothetical protein
VERWGNQGKGKKTRRGASGHPEPRQGDPTRSVGPLNDKDKKTRRGASGHPRQGIRVVDDVSLTDFVRSESLSALAPAEDAEERLDIRIGAGVAVGVKVR